MFPGLKSSCFGLNNAVSITGHAAYGDFAADDEGHGRSELSGRRRSALADFLYDAIHLLNSLDGIFPL
jgi:hypothetical protein